MAKIQVIAGDRLLEGYVKTPAVGICELIWNAFDEDATHVSVSVENDELGALKSVVVEDNGTGMDAMVVNRAFTRVGDSWKAGAGTKSDGGRPVHGRHGRGRYSAFSIGDRLMWESTTLAPDGKWSTVVATGTRSDLKTFDIESFDISAESSRGTRVTSQAVSKEAQKAFDNPDVLRTRLTTEFALHIERFPDFKIEFLGVEIDPSKVIISKERMEVNLPQEVSGKAHLTVVEWDIPSVDRRLYLCDSRGSVIDEVYARVHAPGLQFSAYLEWDGFSEHVLHLEGDGSDDVEAPASERVISAARVKLREHLGVLGRRREAETLKRWQGEGIYPYPSTNGDEPSVKLDPVEIATQEAFKQVALAASRTIDESKSRQTKALALALLKETFETDPDRLFPLLKQLTNLSSTRIDELQKVLDRTSLAHLIQSGHKIGTRIDFLNGLHAILFERQTRKRLQERRQLHRILAHETWIFGEEWSTTGDDVSLGKVLREYQKFLDGEAGVEIADASAPIVEPLRENGSIAIPDLVLGRKMHVSENRSNFLVVELKRPSHKLKDEDVAQIRSYASAIFRDERFAREGVEWRFVLVGNSISDIVDDMRRQPTFPFGYVQMNPFKIEVRTWSEIISDARFRMDFVQDSLKYQSNQEEGLQHLRDAYDAYLPEMDDDPAVDETA